MSHQIVLEFSLFNSIYTESGQGIKKLFFFDNLNNFC